jgi:hypothetical protein
VTKGSHRKGVTYQIRTFRQYHTFPIFLQKPTCVTSRIPLYIEKYIRRAIKMNGGDLLERSGLQTGRRLDHPHIRGRGVYSGDSSIPIPPFHGGPSTWLVNSRSSKRYQQTLTRFIDSGSPVGLMILTATYSQGNSVGEIFNTFVEKMFTRFPRTIPR